MHFPIEYGLLFLACLATSIFAAVKLSRIEDYFRHKKELKYFQEAEDGIAITLYAVDSRTETKRFIGTTTLGAFKDFFKNPLGHLSLDVDRENWIYAVMVDNGLDPIPMTRRAFEIAFSDYTLVDQTIAPRGTIVRIYPESSQEDIHGYLGAFWLTFRDVISKNTTIRQPWKVYPH